MPAYPERLAALLHKVEGASIFEGATPIGLNDQDYTGDTPLHIVCRWDDFDSTDLLVQAGANVNAVGDKSQTPIFCTGSRRIAEMLVKAGATLTIVDSFGCTPEEFARRVGNIEIVEFLNQRKRGNRTNGPGSN